MTNLPAEKKDRYYYYTDDDGYLVKLDITTGKIVATSGDIGSAFKKGVPMNPRWVKGGLATSWVYNDMYRDLICQRIAEGKTLTNICKEAGFPSISTVARWRSENPDFNDAIAAARKMRAEVHHDKIAEALDGIRDLNKEDIPAEKLYIDTNKWLAEKNDPETYGNKVMHEGDGSAPIQMVINTGVPDSDNDKDTIELNKESYSESKK